MQSRNNTPCLDKRHDDIFPTLADIQDKDWQPDGETFTHNGRLWRLNPDFTFSEIENKRGVNENPRALQQT